VLPVDLTPLLQLGAIGAVLAWFLLQMNPRLERVERAIDLLSRTILLDIVSRRDADAVVKSQAESMVRQIDDKYRQRGKGESP
jgi:hypothetical protein